MINATKRRIISEIEQVRGMAGNCWWGGENYVPVCALNVYFPRPIFHPANGMTSRITECSKRLMKEIVLNGARYSSRRKWYLISTEMA